MNTLFKENPVKKMEYIMNQAASGKTNKEIAEELGYKDVHNLYVFMRRKGYVWNSNKGLYVVKGEKQEEASQEVMEDTPTGKIGSIILMFAKKMDGKEIAKSLKFSSYQEMADYMKSKGYQWDSKKGNYIKTVVEVKAEPVKEEHPQAEQTTEEQAYNKSIMEEYGDILKLLKANKDKLTKIFKAVESNPSIPRYTLSGFNIPKTISIASSLDRIVKEFSEEKNISQKDIVEVALVDFLKKYGYESQVKEALHI
ncbi:MAG: hypothetical protein ACOYVK_13825 [Bacillota bacterium]